MSEVPPQTAVCPECKQTIAFAHELPLHHLLLCPHCEMILTVRAIRPLQLDWAFEEPLQRDNLTLPSLPQRPYWQYGVER